MAIITNIQYHYLTKTNTEKREFLQKVLSETGISKTTFYKYVRDESRPPKLVKEKIAELLGIDHKEMYKEYYQTVQPKI